MLVIVLESWMMIWVEVLWILWNVWFDFVENYFISGEMKNSDVSR